MKTLLIFAALLLSVFSGFAQDLLIKRSGEETLVKVLEITPELVKYKRFEYQEGPVISIPNQEVAEIKFANGVVQKFGTVPMPEKTPLLQPKLIRKHALAANVLPLLAGSVNVFYDNRLTAKPNVALSIGGGIWTEGQGLFSNFSRQVILTGAAKFYLEGSDFYVSPYLKYRHSTGYFSQNWHQFGGGGAIGNRHVFKSGFLIDSFLGLGVYGLNMSTKKMNDEYYFEPNQMDLRLGLCIGYAFN